MECSLENTHVRDVFDEANRQFRESLNSKERHLLVEFRDGKSMLSSAEKALETYLSRSSRVRSLFEKLGDLADRLTPYFDVINICIQSNPECASLVWGSLRFMFQVGLNYNGFIEQMRIVFSKILGELPVLELWLSVLREGGRPELNPLQPRVAKAMACVYVDLLEFCHDIFKIFSGNQECRIQSFFVTIKMSWKPFDIRFRDFMRKYNQHSQNLQAELQLQIATKVFGEFNLIKEGLYENRKHIQELGSKDRAGHSSPEEQELAARSLKRLMKWIRPPEWHQAFLNAKTSRLAGTCEWFFDAPIYREWQSFMPVSNGPESAVLLVQGKPGFGKTHLCARLIDHLSCRLENIVTSTSHGHSVVVFFFFDKQKAYSCQPVDAFRAILCQLLQINRTNNGLIDIASFLMDESVYLEPVDQMKATKEEVLDLLNILLSRLEDVTLVIDGVDECSDSHDFFNCLDIIMRPSDNIEAFSEDKSKETHGRQQKLSKHRTKIALFSRPDLKISRRLMDQAYILGLQAHQNRLDIKNFLSDKLEEFVTEGLIPLSPSPSSRAASLSFRADGMFLWAKLLMDYVRCETFSPRDRVGILENIVIIEGLEPLYLAIMRKLQRTLPSKGREAVLKAFKWVAGALRPLDIAEFAVAITIPSDSRDSMGHSNPDIHRILTRISGALLEVSPDHTVRFIHISVKEYLFNQSQSAEYQHQFTLDECQTQLELASACLYYIRTQLPTGPLSGSADVSADKNLVLHKYPLIAYCTQFWDGHFSKGAERLSKPRFSHCKTEIFQFIHQLCHFIGSRDHVTTWVEAAWLFGCPSAVQDLVPALTRLLMCTISKSTTKAVEALIARVWLLSDDLQTLEKQWGIVMTETPNEIWQPSISVFTPSEFRHHSAGATLSQLKHESNDMEEIETAEKAIMIESQTSKNSLELGLIKIIVPREILELSSSDSRCTQGWRVLYEVWCLKRSQIKFRLCFELDPQSVAKIVAGGHIGGLESDDDLGSDDEFGNNPDDYARLRELEFQFPVMFGPRLRSILVLHYLVNITELTDAEKRSDPSMNCMFSIVNIGHTESSQLPERSQPSTAPTVESQLVLSRAEGTPRDITMGATGLSQYVNTIQTSGEIVLGMNSDGLATCSKLQNDCNTVVLHTATEDGTLKAEVISRVPKDLCSLQPAVIFGQPKSDQADNDNDALGLVWTKPAQEYYAFDEITTEEHPVLIHRKRSTIPTFIAHTSQLGPPLISNPREVKKRVNDEEENSYIGKRVRLLKEAG